MQQVLPDLLCALMAAALLMEEGARLGLVQLYGTEEATLACGLSLPYAVGS